MPETRPEYPYPWNAFQRCPGCGAGGLTVRGDRSVQCRRCGYHLYLNVAAAVAGLIEDDIGRVLLTVRAHDPMAGTLDLPGGFVDPDESAEDALIREIEEELNLKARRCSFTYLGSFPNAYPYGGITYLTLDLAFTCSVESFAPQKFSEEIAGVKLFRPSEIPLEQVGFSSIRSILQEYRKTKQR